ncbi:hypothetical protein BC834DRAFT_249009 [Gloeopeniophorella convolvens]|nr:hypothetical protein BC834DRAFT_249009 [Gloeopeniophorella convolvens]
MELDRGFPRHASTKASVLTPWLYSTGGFCAKPVVLILPTLFCALLPRCLPFSLLRSRNTSKHFRALYGSPGTQRLRIRSPCALYFLTSLLLGVSIKLCTKSCSMLVQISTRNIGFRQQYVCKCNYVGNTVRVTMHPRLSLWWCDKTALFITTTPREYA